MTTLEIPDIIISNDNNVLHFESSNDIMYIIGKQDKSQIVFSHKESNMANMSIMKIYRNLKNKNFINLNDRVLLKLEKLDRILSEDYSHYLCMKNNDKISLSKQEYNFMMDHIIKL